MLETLGVLNDAVLVQAFTNATSKVMIRVMRNSMTPPDSIIATKGFAQAMNAVNSCR